jgi:hybrid cluster-associated redox disulfide protein
MAGEKITKDMCIGTVIEQYPATEKVFKKYFGSGCFTCPGSKNEDIAFGSTMHNVEVDAVVRELNEAIASG